MIGPSTPIALRHKRVSLSVAGPPVPDGDGGYIESRIPLDPPVVSARIRPASTGDLERLAAGTVLTQASHIVSIPHHAAVTAEAELVVEDHPRPARKFSVVGVINPEERDADTELLCREVVT